MPRSSRSGWLLTIVLAAGCSNPSGPARRILSVQWDTVWSTGRAFMDSTLPSPDFLTYSDGQVFAFDNTAFRLVALESRTGAMAWQLGQRGQGPAEFLGATTLLPDRAGGVAVLDIQNRRLTRVSAAGRLDAIISLAGIGQQPNQICAGQGNRFVAADVFQAGLIDMDSAGQMVRQRPPLWPDLAVAPGGPPQLFLRNDPSGDWCMVAIGSGRGFGLLSPDREPVVRPYVEELEAYGLLARADQPDNQTWALADAEFEADTLYTLFIGLTTDRYRLLDRYLLPSGAYLGTLRLPFGVGEFAAGDGMLFVVDSSGTRILALRARPSM